MVVAEGRGCPREAAAYVGPTGNPHLSSLPTLSGGLQLARPSKKLRARVPVAKPPGPGGRRRAGSGGMENNGLTAQPLLAHLQPSV